MHNTLELSVTFPVYVANDIRLVALADMHFTCHVLHP